MRQQLRRRPQLESLESMALLSGMMAAPVAALVATTTPMTGHEVDINGTAHGKYHEHQSKPDTGKTYTFNGSGPPHVRARTCGQQGRPRGRHRQYPHSPATSPPGNAGARFSSPPPKTPDPGPSPGPTQNGFAANSRHLHVPGHQRLGQASARSWPRGRWSWSLIPAKATPSTTTTTPAEARHVHHGLPIAPRTPRRPPDRHRRARRPPRGHNDPSAPVRPHRMTPLDFHLEEDHTCEREGKRAPNSNRWSRWRCCRAPRRRSTTRTMPPSRPAPARRSP